MDIKIKSDEGNFKFRVCGILKHKDKYLAVKMNSNQFFCFPGGHVEIGEDINQAVLREMREELGYEVKAEKLIAFIQNFYKNREDKVFHEIGFYFVITALNENDINPDNYLREELDKGKIQHLDFQWFTKEELKNIPFNPSAVIDCLDSEKTEFIVVRE